MNKKDWDMLHVGATIHLAHGNFYVSTVELLGTEKKPKGIGDVWDKNGKKLTRDSFAVCIGNLPWGISWYTPCPSALPGGDGRVIFPGDPLWPEKTRGMFRGERGEHNYSQEFLDTIDTGQAYIPRRGDR